MAVAFDLALWRARFPALGAASDEFVLSLVAEAELYIPVNYRSPIPVSEQLVLVNLAVAHLVALNSPAIQGTAQQGLVGRVTSASEGSVSVSVDAGSPATLTQAWWLQTPWGQQLWTMLGRYRRFRYVAGYPRIARPYSLDRIP